MNGGRNALSPRFVQSGFQRAEHWLARPMDQTHHGWQSIEPIRSRKKQAQPVNQAIWTAFQQARNHGVERLAGKSLIYEIQPLLITQDASNKR
jgi:hypothetical protein